MDTDGYVDVHGRCDLTTIREPLARPGLRARRRASASGPKLAAKRAMLYGRDCGPKYEVQFTPDRPVFRLPRKLARQKTSGRFPPLPRDRRRPSESTSVPVRCIEVSSPDGLFLVTRSFIPTHNSSLGRLGLLIHSTAGFIDPGWDGHVTLELSNVANLPITIYYGMKIGQLSFMQLTEPASAPYGSGGFGSKYQGQRARRRAATGRTSSEILVTGGTGFVGPRVVHELRAREQDVRALVRDPREGRTLEAWGCELVGRRRDATRRASRAAADGLRLRSSTSSRSGRASPSTSSA